MSPKSPKPSIFSYSSYRKYLRDVYLHFKKTVPGFAYATISEKAGFSSPSFIKLVIDGKKNVSADSANRIAVALKLNKQQTSYFKLLVEFEQAEDLETKVAVIARIDTYRKRSSPDRILPADHIYLSKWYYCAIREMVDLIDWKEDPEYISKKLRGLVSPAQVRSALSYLETHGFLERAPGGSLRKRNKNLATGDLQDEEFLRTIARQFHVQMVEQSLQSIKSLPPDERHVTNTTLSLSKDSYKYALQRIESLRMELLELASRDEQVDNVYQLTVNLFPFTTMEDGNE